MFKKFVFEFLILCIFSTPQSMAVRPGSEKQPSNVLPQLYTEHELSLQPKPIVRLVSIKPIPEKPKKPFCLCGK